MIFLDSTRSIANTAEQEIKTAALQILRSKTLAGGKQKRRSNDRLSYMKS